MNQTDIMFASEADAWLERNRSQLGLVDEVSAMIDALGIVPQCVIEVGCSNGWRLLKLQEKYNCRTIGIEPGRNAAIEAREKGLHIKRSSADKLSILSAWADIVIYGFCLYLTDPSDWFRIVAEGDRVLKAGGHIIIHDFAPEKFAYAVPYRHVSGMLAYHFDFAKLWEAHPLYRRVASSIGDSEAIIVLGKLPAKMIEIKS